MLPTPEGAIIAAICGLFIRYGHVIYYKLNKN